MGKLSQISRGMVVIALVSGAVFVARAHAEGSANWLTSDPAVEKLAEVMAMPDGRSGNRDCSPQKVVTRTSSVWPLPISEQSYDGCTVQMGFGTIDILQIYLQGNNTSVAKPLLSRSGTPAPVLPIPNSLTTLYLAGNQGAGSFISYLKLTPTKIQLANNDTAYKIATPYDGMIKDKSGTSLPIVYDTIGFSANGKWMVGNIHYLGAVRVNLETFEVLPFGPFLNYNSGSNPFLQTAITDNGRYAVLSSKSAGMFRVYDLSTCAAVPSSITGPVNCQYKDLQTFMSSKVPGWQGAHTIRFRSNGSFTFYGMYAEGSSTKTAQYVMTAPGETMTTYGYLALGDSFASGEGVHNYRIGTDTENNKCHTSLISYPYLVSNELDFNSSNSIACSGARIVDILDISDDYEGQFEKQRKAERNIPPIFNNFSPGLIAQLEFVENYNPDVITISAVGNDLGFSGKLKRCLEPDTCFSTYEDRLEILREINGKFDDVREMLRQLKQASSKSRIYFVGYPDAFFPDGDCEINVRLNQQELTFAQQLVGQMNSMIERATRAAGVFYVDAENAFDGHRHCETDSSNVAANGLTIGNDIPDFSNGPIGNESYHPNALGHQLLASTILDKTNNLTAPMTTEDPSIGPPAESEDLPILQAPKSGRTIYSSNYDDDLANNILLRQEWWTATVKGTLFGLPPLSTYSLFIHSEPANLGTATTDENGDLNIRAQIPGSIKPGFHTLHVFGKNFAGELIDIYKTVYIAASATDYDGDGIANANDTCVVIEPSGRDADLDGNDDACDSEIGKPPHSGTIGDDSSKPPENNPETEAGNERVLFATESPDAATTNPRIIQLVAAVLDAATDPDGPVASSILGTVSPGVKDMLGITNDRPDGQSTNPDKYMPAAILAAMSMFGVGVLLYKSFTKLKK